MDSLMKVVACIEQGDYHKGTFGRVACLKRQKPELKGPDDVLIHIHFSSICGSDANVLDGRFPIPERLPRALGHEMSGVIEALGPGATAEGFREGDRVTGNFVRFCGVCRYCRTGHENLCTVMERPYPQTQAEYVVWHKSQVHKIPDNVSLMEASLTEPAAIAWHMVDQAPFKPGATAIVIGGGGIGMLTMQMCLLRGASRVTLVEPVKEKRQLARQLGAVHTLDPFRDDIIAQTREITDGFGFDAVFDTTTSVESAETSMEMAGKAAHIVFCSKFSKDARLPVNLYKHLYLEEKHIHGSQMSPYSYPYVVQLLPRLQIAPLIQRIYPLDECEQAYADQLSGRFVKIVFDCIK